MFIILLVCLTFLLIGTLPGWAHSRHWGVLPSGSVGMAIVALLLLMITSQFRSGI